MSGFTNFGCCTQSLGRLRKNYFDRVPCMGKNALHKTIKHTPNFQET